ncbi:MAG TPA: TolC family protein [Candidatus Angelobacter sp.]|nr:TolC family protein [Candidatus Angelobacter sp.]
MKFSSVIAFLCCFFVALSLESRAQEAPLPFRTAIELALRNSAATGIGHADVQRAQANYLQARDLFLPQVTLGSGLAFSYGFPLSIEGSAPSIFDLNTQQFLFNTAQRQFMKAAKGDISTTQAQNADRRNDVIMETALDYIQLDLLTSSLGVQSEQRQLAGKLEDVVSQRVQAGVDAPVEVTRAKLKTARTRMQMAETQAAIDQLRLRLSQLTGLPQSGIQTATESIPELPAVAQDQDLGVQAMKNNSSVKVAEEVAKTKAFRAKGEDRQLYPAVDLVAHYAVLARYNNYDQFFNKFQRNNVVLGVAIRFPFFNSSQRETAKSAEADALKAQKEAQNLREQVSTETLRLQRSVDQLAAARDVFKLEYQLAEADSETTHEKIQAGGATLKDEQGARIAEHERYAAYLNSSFDLDKAQVQLLRQIGQLESWALGPRKL